MFAAVSRPIPSAGDLQWHAGVVKASDPFATLAAHTLSPAGNPVPGQTMTATANGSLNNDAAFASAGVQLAAGNRCLVTNDGAGNFGAGIWIVTQLGDATHPWILTRATDANTTTKLPPYSVTTTDNAIFGGVLADAGPLMFRMEAQTASPSWRPFGGFPPIVNVYGTAGSPHTWTPRAGLAYIVVEVVGGGGQGGGCTGSSTAGHGALGGPGAGGGYARKVIDGSVLAGSYTATTGAGGSTGGTGATGQAGGTSSFAGSGITTIQATGGAGGSANGDSTADRPGGAPNAGGTGTGGDIGIDGSSGGSGWITPAGVRCFTGEGGHSALGHGANPQVANAAGGATGAAAPAGYGGGGGGGYSLATAANRAGGAGAPGVVIVTEFYGP